MSWKLNYLLKDICMYEVVEIAPNQELQGFEEEEVYSNAAEGKLDANNMLLGCMLFSVGIVGGMLIIFHD
jgi:hypothetical protein